jgi:hypothetical protein
MAHTRCPLQPGRLRIRWHTGTTIVAAVQIGTSPVRSISFRDDAAEDLSGLLTAGQKTCPVPGGGNTERLVW